MIGRLSVPPVLRLLVAQQRSTAIRSSRQAMWSAVAASNIGIGRRICVEVNAVRFNSTRERPRDVADSKKEQESVDKESWRNEDVPLHQHHRPEVSDENSVASDSTYSSSGTTASSTPDPANSKGTSKEFTKLLQLARPEFKLILAALACLIVTSAVSMSLPLFMGKIIDTAKPPSDEEKQKSEQLDVEVTEIRDEDEYLVLGYPPYQFFPGLVGFFLVGAAANFGRTFLLRSAGEKIVARLRSRLFSKILSQDSYFFDFGPNGKGSMKTGDLISRISSDTQIISKTLSSNISDGVRSLVSGAGGLGMMCYVSWKLTLCMSLMFPPLVLSSVFYGRKIKKLSKKIQENLGALTKVTEEKLNGLKTIQSFAQQQQVVHDYNKEIRQIYNTSMREGTLSGIFYGGNSFIANVTLIGLLLVGTRFISTGDITLGDLSSFMMYAIYTGSSVFGLGNFYTELMKGIGASDRIFELSDSEPTIKTSIGKKVPSLHGDIEFRNIQFHYPLRPNSQIFSESHPLNLSIKKGEHVCFVGPSGSGKSTISQLLLRFYNPIKGDIFVNGYNIKDLNLNFYRAEIGYVDQAPLLFSGTIRENILFGVKDHNVSEERLFEAAKLSNSLDFVQAFPDGFDTVIGSSGAQLSGGQKQRISLARTLIKNPDILILDEATSALDSHSEEVVMRNLLKLSKEKNTTLISIAHRLSTIKNSENIIVLNSHGEIVESGKFDKLYADQNSDLNKLLKNPNFE